MALGGDSRAEPAAGRRGGRAKSAGPGEWSRAVERRTPAAAGAPVAWLTHEDCAHVLLACAERARLVESVRAQVEYYFSPLNLVTDTFLVKHMDPSADYFVPITEIMKVRARAERSSRENKTGHMRGARGRGRGWRRTARASSGARVVAVHSSPSTSSAPRFFSQPLASSSCSSRFLFVTVWVVRSGRCSAFLVSRSSRGFRPSRWTRRWCRRRCARRRSAR